MNAHDMSDRIRGIVERDGYVPVLSVEYGNEPFTGTERGSFVVQDDDSGSEFVVTITRKGDK